MCPLCCLSLVCVCRLGKHSHALQPYKTLKFSEHWAKLKEMGFRLGPFKRGFVNKSETPLLFGVTVWFMMDSCNFTYSLMQKRDNYIKNS